MIGSFRFEGGAQKTLERHEFIRKRAFAQVEQNLQFSSRFKIAPGFEVNPAHPYNIHTIVNRNSGLVDERR